MDDDKLLGLLREALAEAEDERTAAEAKVARRLAALKAFDGCGATPIEAAHVASAAKREQAKRDHPSAPKADDARTAGVRAAAKRMARCENCDREFSVMGIRRHTQACGGDSTEDPRYAEVARIANEAHREGRHASLAVAAELGVNDSAARGLISRARERGHEIAYERPDKVGAPDVARPASPTVGDTWTPERALAVIEGGT